MAYTVACFCGHDWYGEPPDACPRCGVTLSNSTHPPLMPWAITNQDEIGPHTTTETGEGTW